MIGSIDNFNWLVGWLAGEQQATGNRQLNSQLCLFVRRVGLLHHTCQSDRMLHLFFAVVASIRIGVVLGSFFKNDVAQFVYIVTSRLTPTRNRNQGKREREEEEGFTLARLISID